MGNNASGKKAYKGFIGLLICMIVFVIIAGIGTIAKFGNRIPEIKSQLKIMEQEHKTKSADKLEKKLRDIKSYTDSSYENADNNDITDIEYENNKISELKRIFNFTTSDYIFIAVVLLTGWLIVGIYWIYTLLYVIAKARQTGANVYVFAILTLFTNLFGVLCLWIYIKLHSICLKCGKIQQRKALYCDECGSALYIKCPDCKTTNSMKAKYCIICGRRLEEGQ